MLIILTLCLVLVWLVFSKLKLLKWGWASGTVAMQGPKAAKPAAFGLPQPAKPL